MASVVAFHAHPDDEVLLAGGTLAQLAAAGHRVTVVLATDGGAGLTAGRPTTSPVAPDELADRRRAESARACAILGLGPPVWLGYRDSGEGTAPRPDTFALVPIEEAAAALVAVLRAVAADVLILDDEQGGYGHRDHRRVHRVGVAAALTAGIEDVFEVTVERELLTMATRLCRWVPGLPTALATRPLAQSYMPRSRITHRVDVRRECFLKRAAMREHVSQQGGGDQQRTLAVFCAMPLPLFRLLLGREWFVHRGQVPAGRPQRRLPIPLPGVGGRSASSADR